MARRRRKLESELQNPNIGDEKLKLSLSLTGAFSLQLWESELGANVVEWKIYSMESKMGFSFNATCLFREEKTLWFSN